MGVTVTGLNETIKDIERQYNVTRNRLKRVAVRVSEDILRNAQENVPLQTGTLAGSGTTEVIDNGQGKGISIIVGFDTSYALKMHEGHYTAHAKMTEKQRRKRYRKLRKKIEISEKSGGGGTLYGRRGHSYISRAWTAKKERYEKMLASAGDPK